VTETAAPSSTQLLDRLVDDLSASGALADDWHATFLAVPRHLFVPDLAWRSSADGRTLWPVHRLGQPEAWLEMVYRDEAVVTQFNDGTALTSPVDVVANVDYTSSTSMPTVVAEMLSALRTEPGMNVLEIGTGTGWNTALLAHRLGPENVTSVEIDPVISTQARQALADAGYGTAVVITGDGARGYPGRAPYDRVLSTACVYRVPYPWIAQTRPGGLVVTPWGTEYCNDHLLELTVVGDGTAVGRIVGTTSFMAIREQRVPRIRIGDVVTDDSEQHTDESLSKRHPRWYVADYDARTAIGIRVPRCKFRYTARTDNEPDGILWFLDQWSGSWAAVHHRPGQPGPYRVRQFGPRRLFDEVSAAYRDWKAVGKPPANTWRITVTTEGQHAELSR